MTVTENEQENNVRISIPPHLEQVLWLDFELDRALDLWQSVERELTRLMERLSVKRVHDSRVALRRWQAMWKILSYDGWESKQYRSRIGKKLRHLRKLLGELRDWDVTIELGESFDLPPRLVEQWSKQRSRRLKQVSKRLKQLGAKRLFKKQLLYLNTRYRKLNERLRGSDLPKSSAYRHLETHLIGLESSCHALSGQSSSAKELHKLRLGIKSWRYFLTEFFGLTNLELVRAQQVLGKYNDLSRIIGLLNDVDDPQVRQRVGKMEEQQAECLAEFETLRQSLPFGLRPAIVSLARISG